MRRRIESHLWPAWVVAAAVAGQALPAVGQLTYAELAPDVSFICPAIGGLASAFAVPQPFTVRFQGTAPASPSGRPVKYRHLFKPALTSSGTSITSSYQYHNEDIDFLVGWADAGWSDWLAYPEQGVDVELQFDNVVIDQYYLMAVQVMDHTGAVSLGRGYQRQVANLVVRTGVYRPSVVLTDPYLGSTMASMTSSDIAAGQPLNLFWTATAEYYCGEIISLRHGWDLIDVNDPCDPGWDVAPGLAPGNFRADERVFTSGLHAFHLRVVDGQGAVRVMEWYFRVVPFVDPQYQLPLLLIDQVYDANSWIWPNRTGAPLNDQVYRNAYWHFLAEGYGGVANFNWTRDWRNHTVGVTYEELVGYRAVLCYAKANANQTLFRNFRPSGDVDKYVWLTPYQQQGGNFMLVGDSSQESFLEVADNYMVPMIFETTEETMTIDGSTYRTGFGTTIAPSGDTVLRGPLMYPYATAGIAALDWTAPMSKYIYGRSTRVSVVRSAVCAGLKGLVLVPDFRTNHLVGAEAIADTIYTNPDIDWRDVVADIVDTLSLFDTAAFKFGDDEFTDGNISTRTTPIIPQECTGSVYADVDVPNGLCVEPMFKGIARLDWMREREHARGRTDWPQSRYSALELETGCGDMALTDHEGQPMASALTNGQVFGYLSYKSVPQKPSLKADVYWGFDPYRFDPDGTKQAIRWALEYFGLMINR